MEEKKEIKVSLATVICIVIIIVLAIALGVVYYLGFVKDNNSNNMLANGEATEKNSISVNEEIPETNNNVKQKVEGEYCSVGNDNSEGVIYKFEGNTVKFIALYTTEGTYEIVDNKIKITYTKAYELGEEIDTFPNGQYEELTIVDENTLTSQNTINGVVYSGKYVKKSNKTEENKMEISKEEKVENNGSEKDLNKYKGKKAISLIAKEDTRFVINEIKNNGDTYIISASILEKEPRKILETEYKNILEGQEVTFRNIKWKYDKSINDEEEAIYLKTANNMQTSNMIALRKNNDEKTVYFTNVAGVADDLCDYSNIEVEFEVSKNIKVCSFFGEFEYDNGKLICKNINDEGMETTTPETIDTLIEVCNNNEPGTGGTYEECVAYVSNGNVDAIKVFEK